MANGPDVDLWARPFPRLLFHTPLKLAPAHSRTPSSLCVKTFVNAPIDILNTQAFGENQIKDFREQPTPLSLRLPWPYRLSKGPRFG